MAEDDDDSLIFECVESIAQYIGVDDKLKSAIVNILGLGGADSFDAADLETALKALLSQMVLEEQINDAAGHLADARGYYKDSYQADIQQEVGDDQCLSDLQANQATALGNLTDAGHQLEMWLATPDADSLPDLAATAVPLWAAIWLHVCVYFSEVAKVSPEESINAEGKKIYPRALVLQKMRNYAGDNLPKIATYLNTLCHGRISALSYDRGTYNVRPPSRGPLFWYQRATIYDARLDSDTTLICQLAESDASDIEFATLIGQVWDWYRWVLWNGDASAPAMHAFIEQLMNDQSSRWKGGPYEIVSNMSWNNDFVKQSFQRVIDFGNWASGVRRQLLQLDLVASGLIANAEDGWSWCEQCGVLFYAASPTQICTAPPFPPLGPHGQQGSGNYVLRCDAVGPPPETMQMQDGWRRCNNCGDLFNPGGSNANVCRYGIVDPTKKSHDGSNSANYMLARSAAPAQSTFDIQDGWRWCNKCGVLHYALAKGVCPADGQSHATDGSSDYWLPFLGTLPRGPMLPSSWHP